MGTKAISGLTIEELVTGAGAEAFKGKNVSVHAIGKLNKGEIFLSTYEYGRPWRFKAGGHKAIAGVAKGVVGMRVGGKRRIRVSPHLGYRDQAKPANELFKIPVPPNSVLVFEIELVWAEDS
jgi:FKBP-type peptidyl-prolyl cis-trans isomerase